VGGHRRALRPDPRPGLNPAPVVEEAAPTGGRLDRMTIADIPAGQGRFGVRTRRRRRPLTRTVAINLVLDAVLLVGFVAAQLVTSTGLVIHEVVGIALGAGLLVHLSLHWGWVVRTTRRLVASRPGRETLRWVNNVALLITMTMCVLSGVLSSRVVLPLFGVFTSRSGFWLQVHVRTADLCLFFVAIHVALSWRWVMVAVHRPARRRAGADR
jgi:hypothetical protein